MDSSVDNNKQKPVLFSGIAGLILIGIILALIVFFPCPTSSQYIVFRIVLSVAIGAFAGLIPGFFDFKHKKIISAGGALGVFAFTYVMNPTLLDKLNNDCNEPFTYTIFLETKDGKFYSEGDRLGVKIGTNKEYYPIANNGIIDIKMIPANYREKEITLYLESQLWQFENQNNREQLRLMGENTTIYVVPSMDLCCVKGVIKNIDGYPIQGVKVSIENEVVETNGNGRFDIRLPVNMYKAEQILTVLKAEYQPRTITVYPAIKEDVELILSKE